LTPLNVYLAPLQPNALRVLSTCDAEFFLPLPYLARELRLLFGLLRDG
jgi:hypothetical protein